MAVPLFLLALLTPAAEIPITVTGHAWAPFISPMGEPYRARTADDDTLADWFRRADLNHDGALTAAEMQWDAERFFATLDLNHDGEIDPDELVHYEWEVAPDIQVNSRTRRTPGQPAPAALADDTQHDRRHDRRRRQEEVNGSLGLGGALQGAARYGLLNLPEPVAAADTDFNRGVSLDEFRAAAAARFALLDRAHQGQITLAQLELMRPPPLTGGKQPKRKGDLPDPRIGSPLPSGP